MSIVEFTADTNPNEVESIVIRYSDGIEKEIRKGMALTVQDEGDNAHISMEFLGCNKTDVGMMVEGFVEMGMRMGLFGDTEDSEE